MAMNESLISKPKWWYGRTTSGPQLQEYPLEKVHVPKLKGNIFPGAVPY